MIFFSEQLFLGVFLTFSFCLMGYWIWFAVAMMPIKQKGLIQPTEWPDVSVIVCFKNEEHHLNESLNAILRQDYPQFEVVAMDDYSTDGSKQTILGIHDRKLRYLHASVDAPGKKAALSEAIQKASYPLCLLTDADCTPASSGWIRSMVSSYLAQPGSEIVLGVAPTTEKSGILNLFQQYETTLTAIQYISYSRTGIPYMGVGRNLLYERRLFLENGFPTSASSVPSGDDDLFINHVATARNTTVNTDPEAFVYSSGKPDVFSFLRQKSRHLSTSVHYRPAHKVLLGGFSLAQVTWYLSFLFLVAGGSFSLEQALAFLLTKWGLQITLMTPACKTLKKGPILWYLPLLDLCLFLYSMLTPWLMLKPKKDW